MSKQQVLERHGVGVPPKPLEKITMAHATDMSRSDATPHYQRPRRGGRAQSSPA